MKSDINDLQCFAGILNGRAAILFESEYTSCFKVAGVVQLREKILLKNIKNIYSPAFPRHKHPLSSYLCFKHLALAC